MKSRIFTKGELKVMKEFEDGNRSDKTGLFSRKIRAKIEELITRWLPKSKELEKLIERK